MPLPPVPSARPAAPAPMPSPVMEPPIVKKELSRRDAEVLRKNIELFVDGVMMEDRYKLVDLLNESFTMDMLDLLFKRMTAKLRMILFSRAKTNEFIRIALDPKLPRHTRALATSFIVVGSAASCVMACPKDEHRCLDFWDTIFGALQQEAHDAALASAGGGGYGPATGANMSSTSNGVQQSVDTKAADDEAVAELVEIINVEVKDIQHHGAKSLQRSVVEKEQAKQAAQDNGEEEDEEEEFRNSVSDDEEPRTPTSARTSAAEETDGQTPNGSSKPTTSLPAQGKPNDSAPSDSKLLVGIFSANTANFSSQILRYFAIRGQKGGCILHYLAEHPHLVEVMLANIGHDDTRTLLLHLIYSDHSEAAIQSIFKSRIIDMMIDRLVTFGPPRNAFDRDCVENTFLLLREIVHAPYLTARGVAISAKTIPIDKVTGQDEYVSICGASREMANSSLRKYTSRKVRHVVHLFMQDNQARIEELFMQMIQELTFWSSPVDVGRERRGSVTSMESIEALSLVRAGHPRPVCTAMLSHLFELTETVDFSEEHTKKTGSNAAAATSVGIDCLNFMCSTHLVRTGKLILKKKLRNELQLCQLSVNCMMGLRITSIRKEQPNTTPTSGDTGLIHNKGNQVQFTLDEIEGVESSDWHKHGFMVSVKKKAVMEVELGYMSEQVTRSEEYFAASSEEEKESWIKLLREVINGDLTALEIFCSDDWRSNVREYRRLRECLITSMEHKGHELMVFLKQVIVLNKRRASGFHLYSIVKFLNSVLSNESKRLDQMFVFARLLAVLMQCYEKYPNFNLLLGEITKMILFVLGDFKNKRSRRCPIIGRLLLSQEPEAKLLPLLTKAFVDTEGGKTSVFAGTDTLSNLKLIMESIKLCYKDPKSRSQERVQAVLREDPAWQKLLDAVEQDCTRNPSNSITSLSIPQAKTSSSAVTPDNVVIPVAPTQPSFQEDIINQITRPCYFSAHGFGSSFLEGDGCAFGYMFKERQGGAKWQKVLLVYEYVSYKLWYFYPSGVDETHHIQWKWIVPVGVRSRYTHGHDETHSSVGHHGLYVTAYDHHQDHGSLLHHDTPAGTRELHFSVTKLEDRDQWKAVLSKAAETIQQLARDYTVMQAKLKKPDKKSVTHCQDSTCQQQFKLFRRPHSCKRCGNWFCGKCTQQRLSIPEFGLMHPVRHCRKCYEAAGGLESEVEPKKLFDGRESTGSFSSNGRNSRSGSVATRDSETDRRSSFSNVELYELAHGMVSPRSMLKMRRRMNRLDSIDSPTSAFKVDEMDGENHSRKFFGDDYEESAADELSPYNSPPASVTFMMHDAEDARG